MLLQMALFYSFKGLSSVPFIYGPHHLIYSFVNEYFCCIHVLTIVNSTEMNVGVYVSLQTMVFSGYMPQSGIARLYCCSSIAKSCLTLRPHEQLRSLRQRHSRSPSDLQGTRDGLDHPASCSLDMSYHFLKGFFF